MAFSQCPTLYGPEVKSQYIHIRVCVCVFICRLFGTLKLKGQVGGDSLAVSLSLGFLMAQRVKYLLAIRGDLGSIPK